MKSKNHLLRVSMMGAACLALGAGLTARADYQSTVVSQGPIGYYRLGETVQPPASVVAANIGSVGTDGTGEFMLDVIRGVPGAIVGEAANTAVRFPGVVDGNRVRIPYTAEWNSSGPFTIEFWAKPGQTGACLCPAASVEFISSPVAQRNGWLFYQGDSTLNSGNGWVFRHYNSTGLTAISGAAVNMTLDTGSWYHVVGVFDGANVKIYVNGVLGASTALPAGASVRPVTNAAIPLTFGARADGVSGYWSYNGCIDEGAMYPAALSEAQIMAHYQAGINASPATPYSQLVLADSPTGYWRFSEAADPPAANLGTLGTAGDASYFYAAKPGQVGPRSPNFPGMDSANTAVGFDGASGYVGIPALNLDESTMSMTAWIKPTGSQDASTAIVTCRSANTLAGLRYDPTDPNALSFDWSTEGVYKSGLTIPADQWSFVALIIQPTQALLCLYDGTTFTTSDPYYFDTGAPLQTFNTTTRIGSDSSDAARTFYGLIDEVAVFDRALTIGEVYSQYAAAVQGIKPTVFGQTLSPEGSIFAGDTLTITADAGGTPPLTYQWRRNGANMPGATSATYTKANVTTADSGSYDVVVTNGSGTATSTAASVNVETLTSPSILEHPVGRKVYASGRCALSVQATGGALQYQWQKNGSDIAGATGLAYTLDPITAEDGGTYVVKVSNILGSTTSVEAVVEVIVPAAGTYAAAVVADAPEAWWRLDEPDGTFEILDALGRHDGTVEGTLTRAVEGPTADANPGISIDGDIANYGSIPFSVALNGPALTVECWARTTAESGGYVPVSSYESKKGYFFMRDDNTTDDGIDGMGWWGCTGDNDQYQYYYGAAGAWASGKWTYLAMTVSADTGLRFYKDGVLGAGPYTDFVRNISAPFRIGGVGTPVSRAWLGDVDEVAVYTRVLTAEQIQSHFAAAFGSAVKPTITGQPANLTVVNGAEASFTVVAEGSAPLSYQWSKDGTPIAGATSATLIISAAGTSDQGTYNVVVTNPAGSEPSQGATLTVVPLRFTLDPVSGTVFQGATHTLTAAVESALAATYQWKKCGVAIHGATGNTLQFNGIGYQNAGEYTFVASNSAGTIESSVVVLSVVPVPTFCDLSDDVLLHLRFDGDYQDSSGRGNHATALGSPEFVAGKIGSQGFKFNTVVTGGAVTTANYLSLGQPADLQFGTAVNFSVSYWVKMTGKPGDLPFLSNARNAYTNPGFTFAPSYQRGGWSWGFGATGIYGPDNSINSGQWVHVAHTFDRAGDGITYLNGVQVDSRPAAPGVDLNTGLDVCIGQDPSGAYAEAGEASLDDMGIWKRVLSPYEVTCIYQMGSKGISFDTTGQIALTVVQSCSNIQLFWQSGTLYQADQVGGPWTAVPDAPAPVKSVSAAGAAKFYKIKL